MRSDSVRRRRPKTAGTTPPLSWLARGRRRLRDRPVFLADIYLQALQARQDWPTAEIAPAITLYYALGATLIVFAGRLFDRFGPRRVVATGATVMACGLVLLAHASHPWHVYAAFASMSVGWASMSGAAINIIVAPWFEARRGFAISLALNGSSAGGIVITPALIVLITCSASLPRLRSQPG